MIESFTLVEPSIITEFIDSLDLLSKLRFGKQIVVNRPDYLRAMSVEDSPLRYDLLSTQFWLTPNEGMPTQPTDRCVRICNPFAGTGLEIMVMGFGELGSSLPADQRIIWYTSPDVLEKNPELRGTAKLFKDLMTDVLNYLYEGQQPA